MDVAAPSKSPVAALRCHRRPVPGGEALWGRLWRSSLSHCASMLVGSLQYVVVRGWLVFVVVRVHVIPAHGMVLELVPHQQAPQIGVTIEDDSEEIEYLTLLQFGAAPDRRKRGQMDAVGAVPRAQAQRQRAELITHGEEVIDHFKAAGNHRLADFIDLSLHAVHNLLYLHFFGELFGRPIDAGPKI